MSLTVQMKNDYSSLITQSLQTLGSSSGSDMASLTKTMLGQGGDNTLADYAAIKNGSYGKLLKAYYAEVGNADKESAEDSEEEDSTSSTDTLYDVTASKIQGLSDSISTLFDEYA